VASLARELTKGRFNTVSRGRGKGGFEHVCIGVAQALEEGDGRKGKSNNAIPQPWQKSGGLPRKSIACPAREKRAAFHHPEINKEVLYVEKKDTVLRAH